MELLETLPNGREIYSRPKKNIKLERKTAINLHDTWKSSGNKYKPLFQDKNGQLWEIESGGNTFKTAANPEGYRFGNWVKHLKRGIDRRGRDKAATVLLSEIEAATKSVFPELSKKDTGKTFYILAEPTTGLHFEDIKLLIKVLNFLVDKGNTVLIIEHNLDVIKQMDYIIDIGPNGGQNGGEIIGCGTPENLSKIKSSHTAKYLFEELKSA